MVYTVLPVLGRLRKEKNKSHTGLGYIRRLCLEARWGGDRGRCLRAFEMVQQVKITYRACLMT